jgi:hypothetical protein
MKKKQPSKAMTKHLFKNYEYNPHTGKIYKKLKSSGKKEVGTLHSSQPMIRIKIAHQGKNHDFMAKNLAWFLYYKVYPKNVISNIDHDPFNIRISNLRETSRSEIQSLMKKKKSGSKFRGVCNYENCGSNYPLGKPWHAQIASKGIRYHLGFFAIEEEAAKAYNVKATELFGNFARLNEVK